MKRFSGWTAALALIVAAASVPLAAQTYPDHPIRLIVPYGTGGVTDITARTMAPLIGDALKGSIVVENKAGASTQIGTDAVAKARPDGYTLLLASGAAIAANPVLFKQMPYDVTRDLVGISLISTVPYVLVVHPSVPANNAAELIAMAKAKPKSIDYSSAGNGSGNHLTAELFANMAGIEVQHIPYKSGGAMVTDLIAGNVSFAFAALPTALPHIKGGKLKAIGVSGETRNGSLPDVPTIRESGLPGFVIDEWLAIFAPAGTPPDIVAKLNASVNAVLANPEAVTKLKNLGATAAPSTPARLDALLKSDIARWGKLAQTVKFEMD